MGDQAFAVMLEGNDPDFELTYFGSSIGLDVFNVYRRADGKIVGQLRCGKIRTHILRFDLPQDTVSPSPLVVEEDEDGDRWAAPGWDTRDGFVKSLGKYPL